MVIRINKESLGGSIRHDDADASDINIAEIKAESHGQKCADGECRLEWDDD